MQPQCCAEIAGVVRQFDVARPGSRRRRDRQRIDPCGFRFCDRRLMVGIEIEMQWLQACRKA